MTRAYLNRIATALPPHEVHDFFVAYAGHQLQGDPRAAMLFRRMAHKGGIEQRYGCFAPAKAADGPSVDRDGLFARGSFPSTAERMKLFEREAPPLAAAAVEDALAGDKRVTHLVLTCCTGLSAPGLDMEIVERCGLDPGVERTIIGFMGCYAAINALKYARHVVRSEPSARVLCVNLELCTIHLRETTELEEILTFFLWGDGCAASVVSAEPSGLELEGFRAVLAPDTKELMSWHVRDQGFDMVLSGAVPAAIESVLKREPEAFLQAPDGRPTELWAVHPGGRSVLDAVQRALNLAPQAVEVSRSVLRRFGNMSSGTVSFVLRDLLEASLRGQGRGQAGCAMAFGPGLVAETMRFSTGTAA